MKVICRKYICILQFISSNREKGKKNFEKFTISMNRKKKSSYIVGNDEIFN